jgi:hypothetical protein
LGHDGRHLGSGMIRGIGPIYASKLEVAFAAEVFELRELASERQREVPGIGKVRAGCIVQAWADQQLRSPASSPYGPGGSWSGGPDAAAVHREDHDQAFPCHGARSSWAPRISAWGPRPTARRNGSSTQSWLNGPRPWSARQLRKATFGVLGIWGSIKGPRCPIALGGLSPQQHLQRLLIAE